MIKEEEIHTDGNHFVKTHAYDFKGNRTSSTDIYGNTTEFVYDRLGRLVKRVLPPIPNLKGELFFPEEVFSYNELNHPKEKKDGDGNLCRIQTNLYGNPYRIENPDGSVETFVYNPDGTVKESIDGAGTRTLFQYDYKKRTISEEKFSTQNKLISSKKWVYNAFHLLQEIDPEGVVTTYSYDSAGRVSVERRGEAETLYFYDSLGREMERWQLCGDNEYRIQAVAYDLLDQVIEERTQTPSGEVLLKKQYGYDVDGNRTHETVFTEAGPLTTVTHYNAHGQPLCVTAPDGTETHFVYNYHYRDGWNLSVPYEETIDPLGNIS
ncbi:MAG: RHS repeat domain-containing protein, partial [Waddliaceae bacterium]